MLWCSLKGRHKKDQCNRIENSERKPHKYNQLNFDKDVKGVQWKKMLFSTKGNRAIRYSQAKKKEKMNFKLCLTLCTKLTEN